MAPSNVQPPNGYLSLHSRGSSAISIQSVLEDDSRGMAESPEIAPKMGNASALDDTKLGPSAFDERRQSMNSNDSANDHSSIPPTPGFSRSASFSDYDESIPPPERLTVFDFLENLALPQRLEKLQGSFQLQAAKARQSRDKLKQVSGQTKHKVIEEWRRRVPGAEEQLDKYKRRMKTSVDRLGKRWSDSKNVTLREKGAFIAGVMNIFLSGYLIGRHPELFQWWYSAQLAYFMPVRYFTYKRRGMHYFLADLCYFVNFLVLLSIWVFPRSKRLFIGAYCLAMGNNAIAIAMWRNSLVFHSLDKITSLFIHIMPCVTLHCIVHLLPKELQLTRFPAVHTILYSQKGAPEHYTLPRMMIWASLPYAVWQLSYHFFISVRRADKIAAGRPTSFTWLRRSFAGSWIGKFVLSLPDALQEPAYMGIQYIYALGTMIPCPLWFYSRWASGLFLGSVFIWSVWNGATYYIDVFGMRFQKELEQLKRDVAKWQGTPDSAGKGGLGSPLLSPITTGEERGNPIDAVAGEKDAAGQEVPDLTGAVGAEKKHASNGVGAIPLLDAEGGKGSGVRLGGEDGQVRERK